MAVSKPSKERNPSNLRKNTVRSTSNPHEQQLAALNSDFRHLVESPQHESGQFVLKIGTLAEQSAKSTKFLDSAKNTIPAMFDLDGNKVELTLQSFPDMSPSW